MDIVGIGTDIAECARIEKMIEKHGAHFVDHVYTPSEVKYCEEKKRSQEHFAGRWAAKEAVLKALGTGWSVGISWKDVEIQNDLSGKPRIVLSGEALCVAQKQGIDDVLISISHCSSHAIAYAIAVKK